MLLHVGYIILHLCIFKYFQYKQFHFFTLKLNITLLLMKRLGKYFQIHILSIMLQKDFYFIHMFSQKDE